MRISLYLILAAVTLSMIACTTKSRPQPTSIQFDSLGGHVILIPVTVNDKIKTSFLLDTGAGVNAISERLCVQIGCKKSGSYTGKRMTGEEVTLKFTNLPQLSLGNRSFENTRAGVIDIFEKLPKELGKIDGAISLRLLENTPFTIDYRTSTVTLNNSPPKNGTSVPLQIIRDQEKTMAFVKMKDLGLFEVDTGNSLAVLNLSKANILNVNLKSPQIKKVEGKNETGFPYVAYYTSIEGLQTLTGNIAQKTPTVAFKKLIHDGVLGNDFFANKAVTFDISDKNMVFH